MQFRATGRDKDTGEYLEMTFEAANAQTALAAAERRGIIVEAVNPVKPGPPALRMPPPLVPSQQYAAAPVYLQAVAPAPPKEIRFWAVLFVIAAFIATAFKPEIGFAIAGLLVVLVVVYLIPGGAIVVRGPLGVAHGRPIRTTLKLTFVAGLAFALFAAANVSKEMIENSKREAEQAAIRLAEQQKLTREANANVDTLMVDVRKQFLARNVPAAMSSVKAVLAIPNATNKGDAQRMSDAVALSKDGARVKTLLVEMSDEDFKAFATTQKTPAALDGIFPVVTEAIVALAKPLVATVGPERAALAKKRAVEAEQRKQEAIAAAVRDEQAAAAARKAEAEKAAASLEEERGGTGAKIGAWTMAEQFVKNQLKAPSTADFGSVLGDYQDPEKCVVYLGSGKYSVHGWVDAQNSFGAKIRSRFSCDIEDVGGDRWKCLSVTIE